MVILYPKCLTDTLRALCSRAGAADRPAGAAGRGELTRWRNGPAGAPWCRAKGGPVSCVWRGTTPGLGTGWGDQLENGSREEDPGAVAGG